MQQRVRTPFVQAVPESTAPFLSPVEKPQSVGMKLVYFGTRRTMGRVLTPLSVFCARMPFAFAAFYGKVSRLDKKLEIPTTLSFLVRARVSSINGCEFCQDAARWYAGKQSKDNLALLDALGEYKSSPLFDASERAALDYVSALTRDKHVDPATFSELRRHYGEREICDLVWLVASEHLYNLNNIGLNIGSDGLCNVSRTTA